MKDTRFRSAFCAGAVTPQDVLAFHRATFGSARMEDPPERPEGVSEEEWDALQDTGKRALVREREARQAAERERDEAKRTVTAPPKPTPPAKPAGQGGQQPSGGQQQGTDGADLAQVIADAVKAAVAPIQQAQSDWLAQRAAESVRDEVLAAARGRFHDPSDALTIDLTKVVTDGRADKTKISAELDDLLTRKPYLGADPRRRAEGPVGATPPSPKSEDEAVKTALAAMQAAAGIKATT